MTNKVASNSITTFLNSLRRFLHESKTYSIVRDRTSINLSPSAAKGQRSELTCPPTNEDGGLTTSSGVSISGTDGR